MLKNIIILTIATFLVACGPTVVQDPGYDPYAVGYHPVLPPVVIYNGNPGYWVGGIFHPQVMIGGVYGYRGAGGQFNTSTSNRTTIINNYNTARNRSTTNYGTQSGSYTRSAGTVTQPIQKPNYGTQTGGVTRGYSSGSTTQNKPSYGSQMGSATRPSYSSTTRSIPSYSAPSRPSYSSSTSSSSTRSSSRR